MKNNFLIGCFMSYYKNVDNENEKLFKIINFVLNAQNNKWTK